MQASRTADERGIRFGDWGTRKGGVRMEFKMTYKKEGRALKVLVQEERGNWNGSDPGRVIGPDEEDTPSVIKVQNERYETDEFGGLTVRQKVEIDGALPEKKVVAAYTSDRKVGAVMRPPGEETTIWTGAGQSKITIGPGSPQQVVVVTEEPDLHIGLPGREGDEIKIAW